jgi:NAD+ synthase
MRLIPRLPSRFTVVAEEFIKSKVDAAGANGVVVGLSGGLDSSVVVALCARALGPKNVCAVFLPEDETPDQDRKDAEDFAKALKVDYRVVHISHDVETLETSLKEARVSTSKNVIANLKARARMVILYGIANSKNYIIAGTSNKSEMLVGYFTKYGDGASDIAPIGDLFKTQVRQLAEIMEIPDHIIDKPPTAGLYPGQTDEAELGLTYEVLDQILVGLDMSLKPASIVKNVFPSKSTNVRAVNKVIHMMETSAHKRHGTKVLKVGSRTIGVDRRETNH